ncbi:MULTISPECIES: hypothetical protein [unclassified Mesorhizobium]|uniref:hypothetical protein n=1 Tax=unclassified Mesorhizobium TaxID=325217 RepID=UPI000FD74D9B|nr:MULTISPECIES: hypothetical protein [unclassified Mesorhizobium]TGR39114.1 hypothetical protein EN842_41420 [bacterium M00.F.Ca.ET.199.01.1.1]TGR46707.1 hypothetical protein EN841_21370 [Mesorhizobium sp. M8A.F.Ca.ET.198.01.1.1]TGV85219.1 hypothetical protein EN792_019100 [Mesorhizobium sp. M00.F.Ca.ET.149.01.1.1]
MQSKRAGAELKWTPLLNMQLIASQTPAYPISLVQKKGINDMLHGALNSLRPEPGGLDSPIGTLPET